MTVTKDVLIAKLKEIIQHVEDEDSAEGFLYYYFGEEKDTYEVRTFIELGTRPEDGI